MSINACMIKTGKKLKKKLTHTEDNACVLIMHLSKSDKYEFWRDEYFQHALLDEPFFIIKTMEPIC